MSTLPTPSDIISALNKNINLKAEKDHNRLTEKLTKIFEELITSWHESILADENYVQSCIGYNTSSMEEVNILRDLAKEHGFTFSFSTGYDQDYDCSFGVKL